MQFQRYSLGERHGMIPEFTATNQRDECYDSIRSYLDQSFPKLLWENLSGFLSLYGERQPHRAD
jgi:hypothetical protein